VHTNNSPIGIRKPNMTEKYDRLVNCPLCKGSLQCFKCYWVGAFQTSTYYTDDQRYQGEAYSYSRVACPLCDGTGTALARVTEARINCPECHGAGTVGAVVRLEVGARKERSRCFTCGGSGQISQQRIEIETHHAAVLECSFFFGDKQYRIEKPYFSGSNASHVTVELIGPAKEFFAKWQPLSQSPYVREKREKQRQELARKASEESEQAKQLQLTRFRMGEGLCLDCGLALGFLDKVAGREKHKRCPSIVSKYHPPPPR
jgi:hypothetical protein